MRITLLSWRRNRNQNFLFIFCIGLIRKPMWDFESFLISSGAQSTSQEFFCCGRSAACTHKLQVPCASPRPSNERFLLSVFSRAHYQGRSCQVRNSHSLGKRFLPLIKGLGKFLFLLFWILSKGTQNFKSKFWTSDYSMYKATYLFCTTKFFSKNTYFLPSAPSFLPGTRDMAFREGHFINAVKLRLEKCET